MAAFGRIREFLPEHILINNGAHAQRLYNDKGLNTMVGKPMGYAFRSNDYLLKLAEDEKRMLLLYPGSMPLILTHSGNGVSIPWRLLQKPMEFGMLHRGETQTIRLARSVARHGDESKMGSAQPVKHHVFDPSQKQIKLGLQPFASIGHRWPVRLALQQVEFDDPVVPGAHRFRLIPLHRPMQMSPPVGQTHFPNGGILWCSVGAPLPYNTARPEIEAHGMTTA